MSKKKIPGSREEDSWFSEEQLDQLESAENDQLRSPIPTQMVSNGEYMPNPQTDAQRRVEARIQELAGEVSKKLGVSRRQFLAGAGGMAASFVAMNEVHGAEFFKVSREEMFEPEGPARHGPPADLFVFDDQLHTIAALGQGTCCATSRRATTARSIRWTSLTSWEASTPPGTLHSWGCPT